jgi:stage III sporulation protein AF
MIEFMSSWVKELGLAIVIVSILEMLLPNNKTKKYIRMVMGIYVLFTIISPFINNQENFNINDINLEEYTTSQASTTLDQTSMDERIKELYIQELEKDITKKLAQKGYEVLSCKVKANISDQEEETKISKIKVNVKKSQENANNQNEESENNEENLENQIVTQIQKIKPVDTSIKEDNSNQEDIETADIQNIKKFLIEEYGVSEKCLEIN